MTTIVTNVTFTPGVDFETYRALPALNVSRLKRMGISPLHFRHAGDERTAAKSLGTAAHAAILEPELFAAMPVYEGVRRGKDWDAFQAQHAGANILTAKEHAEAVAMAAAVELNPAVAKLLHAKGARELTITWDRDGRPCKGRVDLITQSGAAAHIVDLKTARDIDPRVFGAQAYRLGYHVQAAWYHDAVAAYVARGKTEPRFHKVHYTIIAIESSPPYDCIPFRVPPEIIDVGRAEYEEHLARLAVCEQTGRWPGRVDGDAELELPAWAMAEDIEISEIDEEDDNG